MAKPTILDRTFSVIMRRMVETGQAHTIRRLHPSWACLLRKARRCFKSFFPFAAFQGGSSPKGTPSFPSHPSIIFPPITA